MWTSASMSLSHLAPRLLNAGIVICLIISFNDQGCNARNLRHRQRHGDGGDTFPREEVQRPIFQEMPHNITVGPGDRAVLRCRVEHLGTKKVSWHKEGTDAPLTIALFTFIGDSRVSVDFNQRSNEWSLIIQDIKPEDEGTYFCLISSKEMPTENLSYRIKLNVKTVQVTGENYVEKGQPLHLFCNATGKPYPPKSVEWFKNGQKIESDAHKGILITRKIDAQMLISVLVIQESDMSHAGDYVCRSTNRDAGAIKIHILNVSATNVKRDSPAAKQSTKGGQSGLYTSQQSQLSTLVAFLVTLYFTTRWHHCV